MAAGLEALRDDGVATLLVEPARFCDRRRRRQHLGACRLHALEQRIIGQAEMEVDDLGLQLLDERAQALVERLAIRARHVGLRVKAELDVIRREPLAPGRFSLGIEARRLVAEEVDVDRSRLPCRMMPSSALIWSSDSNAQGSDPSPPASATAIASSAVAGRPSAPRGWASPCQQDPGNGGRDA
jgi:hypothetical protein